MAALEFALVLPLLLALVFGGIDFGYLINRSSLINNAAREGAREAIFNPDSVAIEDRVRWASSDLDQGRLDVSVTCRAADGSPCPGVSFENEWESGGTVIVRVAYLHEYLTPIPPMLGIGQTRTVSSTVEMRIE